nr:hypothetical protein [Nonomuraea sp. SYSU D8015]
MLRDQPVRLHIGRARMDDVVAAVSDADGLVRAAGERGGDEHITFGAACGPSRERLHIGERTEPHPPA